MEPVRILKGAGRILLHTTFAFVASLCAGFTMELFRNVVGAHRYARFASSNVAAALLILAAAVSGFVIYVKWHDRLAFFAWVPAAFLSFHHFARKWTGDSSYPARLEVSLALLAGTAAYAAGASLAAFVTRKVALNVDPFSAPPVRPSWGGPSSSGTSAES